MSELCKYVMQDKEDLSVTQITLSLLFFMQHLMSNAPTGPNAVENAPACTSPFELRNFRHNGIETAPSAIILSFQTDSFLQTCCYVAQPLTRFTLTMRYSPACQSTKHKITTNPTHKIRCQKINADSMHKHSVRRVSN